MKRGKRGRGRKSTPKYGLNLPDLDQARSAALNSLPSQESQRGYHAPDWVKSAIDSWLVSAGVSEGRVFRCVCRAGKTWGEGVTERVVWHVVKDCTKRAAIENVAPHDSVQTTEKYLGCKQRLQNAVNDRIGIEPNGQEI